MRVLVLRPRLDVPFKNFGGPLPAGPEKPVHELEPIRQHWENFYIRLAREHLAAGDEVVSVCEPLWRFDETIQEHAVRVKPDLIYVPHRERGQIQEVGVDLRFCAQTVIPHIFTIDSEGYSGGRLDSPIGIFPDKKHLPYYDYLKARAFRGETKFSRDPEVKLASETIPGTGAFVCQLPHDHVIKYHSAFSVEECLSATIDAYSGVDASLVVRGHPVNPASMRPLLDIVRSRKNDARLIWDDGSENIHRLLSTVENVFCVNSGVGFEALLHGRQVFTFGISDYEMATRKCFPSAESIRYAMEQMEPVSEDVVRCVVNAWYEGCYDLDSPVPWIK